jgi:hypothetical protein
MRQEPGFDRRQETGADQPAAQQVPFGAGEAVRAGEHRARSGAGGEHDRDLRDELGKKRNGQDRNMTGTEPGDDQAVEPGAASRQLPRPARPA